MAMKLDCVWIWAQIDQFCDAKIETRKSVNPHNNNNLVGLQTVLSEKQTRPFGFVPATQEDRKTELFRGDLEWTASAESGSDHHIMLLDKVENL